MKVKSESCPIAVKFISQYNTIEAHALNLFYRSAIFFVRVMAKKPFLRPASVQSGSSYVQNGELKISPPLRPKGRSPLPYKRICFPFPPKTNPLNFFSREFFRPTCLLIFKYMVLHGAAVHEPSSALHQKLPQSLLYPSLCRA